MKWGPTAKGEHRCRPCGSAYALHLHHAVPRSICPKEAKADLRNGVPLCARCHMDWHQGKPLPREMFTEDEWGYIETLIGPDWLDRRYPES